MPCTFTCTHIYDVHHTYIAVAVPVVQLVMYCICTLRSLCFEVLNTMVVLFIASAIVTYSDHLYNEYRYSVKNYHISSKSRCIEILFQGPVWCGDNSATHTSRVLIISLFLCS